MTDTPSNGKEPDRDTIQDADDELLRGLNRRKRTSGSERALLPEYEDVHSHSELFEVAGSGWARGTSFHPRLKGCDLEALKENFSEVEAVSREFPLLIGCVSICQPTTKRDAYAKVKGDPIHRPESSYLLTQKPSSGMMCSGRAMPMTWPWDTIPKAQHLGTS